MGQTVQVIRWGDLRKVTWKNGAGTAVDVVVEPAGAAFDDIDWRVNVATFDRDVPFSSFPGIDRTQVVLSGGPFDLLVEGHPDTHMTINSGPYAFPGDRATEVRQVQTPVRVLNVLTGRGRYRSAVELIRGPVDRVVTPGIETVVLFVATGNVEVQDGTTNRVAGGGDAIVLDAEDVSVRVPAGSRVYVVQISRKSQPDLSDQVLDQAAAVSGS